MIKFTSTGRVRAMLLAIWVLMLPHTAFAQDAETEIADQATDDTDEVLSEAVPATEIVVTGFRESLNA